MRGGKEGDAPSFGLLVLPIFRDHLTQELLQALAKLSLLHRSDFLDGGRGRGELV